MNAEAAGTIVPERIGKAGTTVKKGMVSTLKGLNEIEAEITSFVRHTVSDTLREGGEAAKETLSITRDVVKGARLPRKWAQVSS